MKENRVRSSRVESSQDQDENPDGGMEQCEKAELMDREVRSFCVNVYVSSQVESA